MSLTSVQEVQNAEMKKGLMSLRGLLLGLSSSECGNEDDIYSSTTALCRSGFLWSGLSCG
jgi:hypothetical protein